MVKKTKKLRESLLFYLFTFLLLNLFVTLHPPFYDRNDDKQNNEYR